MRVAAAAAAATGLPDVIELAAEAALEALERRLARDQPLGARAATRCAC